MLLDSEYKRCYPLYTNALIFSEAFLLAIPNHDYMFDYFKTKRAASGKSKIKEPQLNKLKVKRFDFSERRANYLDFKFC